MANANAIKHKLIFDVWGKMQKHKTKPPIPTDDRVQMMWINIMIDRNNLTFMLFNQMRPEIWEYNPKISCVPSSYMSNMGGKSCEVYLKCYYLIIIVGPLLSAWIIHKLQINQHIIWIGEIKSQTWTVPR